MSYTLANAKVWDGAAWVEAVGGLSPWYASAPTELVDSFANVTVTADTAAHTKGAWTEVAASLAEDSTLLVFQVSTIGVSGTNTATLIDVGVGASGSETAIAQNIAVGGAAPYFDTQNVVVLLPVAIASGTRVSCRIQSVVTGGKTARVDSFFYQGGDSALLPTSVDVLGTSTADSQGTSMSGSSGSYVQVTASTLQRYRAIGVIPSVHGTSIAGLSIIYTLAVGGAGVEQDLGVAPFATSVQESARSINASGPLFLISADVPTGSRLSVKHDIVSNPDRYGVTLVGIP